MTKDSPNTLRNSILERINNPKIKHKIDTRVEYLLDTANLRDAHTRLKEEKLKFIISQNFKNFIESKFELESAKAHSTGNFWNAEHKDALNNAIFALQFREIFKGLKAKYWFGSKVFSSTQLQNKFSEAFTNSDETAQNVFSDEHKITNALNEILDNPSTEPYIAAKKAAILMLALETPQAFGNWIPEYVEQEPQPEPEATMYCYKDSEGLETCEPTTLGETQDNG